MPVALETGPIHLGNIAHQAIPVSEFLQKIRNTPPQGLPTASIQGQEASLVTGGSGKLGDTVGVQLEVVAAQAVVIRDLLGGTLLSQYSQGPPAW
jgi:hypothetical protein